MDLAFNAEERAFEQEVRDFIAANLTPEMKRATALTPSVFSDPDIGMAWQRAGRAGAHRAGRWIMAGRTGRRRSAGYSRPNPPAPACRT
jgi:acyl-CoA dehydrogenase